MDLRDAIAQRGPRAYLLTVSPDGPHAGQVEVTLADDALSCPLGDSAAVNIAHNANVSLLWPPIEQDGYSLIVNGVAARDGDRCSVAVTKSVLHRPGAATQPGCSADCIRLAH